MLMHIEYGYGFGLIGETPNHHHVNLFVFQNEWLLIKHLHQIHENMIPFIDTVLSEMSIDIDEELIQSDKGDKP